MKLITISPNIEISDIIIIKLYLLSNRNLLYMTYTNMAIITLFIITPTI